jgi:3-hydroxyacyl-[acyl-carrier-protein] dehydratase
MRLEFFQMVDRITSIDPNGTVLRADCLVPDASPVFEGHFPGYPLLPGVLMIETMAQTGGWLLLALFRFDRMPFLTQVREAKIRSFVVPGQKLEAVANLVHDGSGYAVIEAIINSAGKKVAEAEIRYRVMAFPNDTLRMRMLETARRISLPGQHFEAFYAS